MEEWGTACRVIVPRPGLTLQWALHLPCPSRFGGAPARCNWGFQAQDPGHGGAFFLWGRTGEETAGLTLRRLSPGSVRVGNDLNQILKKEMLNPWQSVRYIDQPRDRSMYSSTSRASFSPSSTRPFSLPRISLPQSWSSMLFRLMRTL